MVDAPLPDDGCRLDAATTPGAPVGTPEAVALRRSLPDHASHEDERGVAIDRVGISGLRWPITVWDRSERTQSTVATITATVALPPDVKGTHMSRFVEVLDEAGRELSLRSLPLLLAAIQRRLEAQAAQVVVEFPYFIVRHAPVSKVPSLMEYGAAFHASRDGEQFCFELEVTVPVTTLCPCSKAVSERGAHNQRSRVNVRLRPRDFLWIEDVVEAVEACASAPLFALLKREDEKWVTEHAYDHPVFVEDLIREVTLALRDRVSHMVVTVENLESIHNHSAWARLTWPGPEGLPAPAPAPPPGAEPLPFGEWLRRERVAHGWSQQELAGRVCLGAPHLSKVESGERHLPDAAFERLAEVLGENADRLRLRAGVVPARLLDAMRRDPERFLALGG